MLTRRTVLRSLGVGASAALAGCGRSSGVDGDGGTPGTEHDLGQDCRSAGAPDFEDIPAWPGQMGDGAAARYAREFERAYLRHTADEELVIDQIDVVSASSSGPTPEVQLDSELEYAAALTPGSTATSLPIDAREWLVTYVLADGTVERTARWYPDKGIADQSCWTVSTASESGGASKAPRPR